MGFANCARSATAAPFPGHWHWLALHPSARTLLLLSIARAVLYRSRGQRQYGSAAWPVPRDLSSHASAQSSATTASATISSGRVGSAASAAASSVQPPAVVSACKRRSRASITAMTTSSRCKPSPQHQWRLWPRSCARVPWGDHGFMPSLRRGVAGNARARLGNSTAPTGARCAALARGVRAAHFGGLWRTRAARATCAAHRQ
jgi:hypothetical protein